MPGTPAPTRDAIDVATRQGGYFAQIFGALSAEGRARFQAIARTRVVAPRTVLAAQGEPLEEVGFVLGGTLSLSKLFPDGRLHIMGLLVPTDMYGRAVQGPTRHRIEALSDARLLCLARATFAALLAEEPAAERVLLLHALEELDEAREWVVLLSGTKVVNRVAAFLVMLARRKASGLEPAEGLQVRLVLPRADLASYLGTRPETLSRALHELAARGIIRILDPQRFQILDVPALLAAAGQNQAIASEPTR